MTDRVSLSGVSIHELIRRVGAAEHLDVATKRLASAIDVTDTDEGMERVQTKLNAAIFDAIRTTMETER